MEQIVFELRGSSVPLCMIHIKSIHKKSTLGSTLLIDLILGEVLYFKHGIWHIPRKKDITKNFYLASNYDILQTLSIYPHVFVITFLYRHHRYQAREIEKDRTHFLTVSE